MTQKIFEKLNSKSIEKLQTKEILFAAASRFTLGLISSKSVSKLLRDYFSSLISRLAEKVLPAKVKKFGYMIAAMGSFGSGELTFKSDIDLIFVVNNINLLPDIQKYFQNLLLKLKEDLKSFEVDCRLRPEGKSSNITWDSEKYEDYILHRARTWELQAFTKLCFITGDKKIFNNLNKSIRNRISISNHKKLKNDIREMRTKLYPHISSVSIKSFNIKKSRGGLNDIEFIVQFILLSNKRFFLTFRGKRIDDIISRLSLQDKVFDDLHELKDNFNFLKDFEMTNQNIFGSSTSLIPLSEERLTPIAKKMGYNSAELLQKKISEVMKSNQASFIKYFEG